MDPDPDPMGQQLSGHAVQQRVELTKSPAGAWQWTPKVADDNNLAPAADDPAKRVPIIMTTADMAMRFDPAYEPIARHFQQNPAEFADALRVPGSN